MRYSRSKSRVGLTKGWSLAFLRASSNLRLRTSSFLLSASQESRNLSSRLRACSARMRAASLISTSGAALGGATCESTTESSGSTVSFDWQHGHVTSIGGTDFFAMPLFYAINESPVTPSRCSDRSGRAHTIHSLDFPRPRLQNSGMALEFTTAYLKDSIDLLRYYKRLGDGPLQQVPDESLLTTLDVESNSIATIVTPLT